MTVVNQANERGLQEERIEESSISPLRKAAVCLRYSEGRVAVALFRYLGKCSPKPRECDLE